MVLRGLRKSNELPRKTQENTDVMTVTLGTLDAPDALVPQVAIFARSRRSWDTMDPHLAAFDAQPSWKPADGV